MSIRSDPDGYRPLHDEGRAKRIQRTYFKQLHPLSSLEADPVPWLRRCWPPVLRALPSRGNQRIYNSGRCTAHAMFEPSAAAFTCRRRAAGAGGFLLKPSDQSCSPVTPEPIHHETRSDLRPARAVTWSTRAVPSWPPCPIATARGASDLATKDGRPSQFATKVTSFDRGHPEFG